MFKEPFGDILNMAGGNNKKNSKKKNKNNSKNNSKKNNKKNSKKNSKKNNKKNSKNNKKKSKKYRTRTIDDDIKKVNIDDIFGDQCGIFIFISYKNKNFIIFSKQLLLLL